MENAQAGERVQAGKSVGGEGRCETREKRACRKRRAGRGARERERTGKEARKKGVRERGYAGKRARGKESAERERTGKRARGEEGVRKEGVQEEGVQEEGVQEEGARERRRGKKAKEKGSRAPDTSEGRQQLGRKKNNSEGKRAVRKKNSRAADTPEEEGLKIKKFGAAGNWVRAEPKRKKGHKKRKPGIGLSPNSTVSSPT